MLMTFNHPDDSHVSYEGKLLSGILSNDTIDTCGKYLANDNVAEYSDFTMKSNINRTKKENSSVSRYSSILHAKTDPYGPYQVQNNVHLLIEKWGKVFPIPPDQFLLKLVHSRGFKNKYLEYSETSMKKRSPSLKQTMDYDNELVRAVRTSNLLSLKTQYAQGKCMSACNKYSESIVHMACRRSEFAIVDFVLSNGGDVSIVDDYGRTVLHDACWRIEPRFDIVTMILDNDSSILFYLDARGCSPLKYVREEHWIHWCAYLFHQKDKYWPINTEQNNVLDCNFKRRKLEE